MNDYERGRADGKALLEKLAEEKRKKCPRCKVKIGEIYRVFFGTDSCMYFKYWEDYCHVCGQKEKEGMK